MTITLTEARTRILKLVDDVDGIVADSDTVKDDALKSAFHAVYLQAAQHAPQRFAKTTQVTTDANGEADLSTLDPVRILSVSHYASNARSPIPAMRLDDGPTNALGVKTLEISYLPALAFPASGAANFAWGQADLDLPILDDLLCLRAASTLTALMDQPNAQLELLIARAEKDVANIANFSTWRVMPLRGRSTDSGLGYVMTDAVSLQLVRL